MAGQDGRPGGNGRHAAFPAGGFVPRAANASSPEQAVATATDAGPASPLATPAEAVVMNAFYAHPSYPTATGEWRTPRQVNMTDSCVNWKATSAHPHAPAPVSDLYVMLKAADGKQGCGFHLRGLGAADGTMTLMDHQERAGNRKIPINTSRKNFDWVLRNPADSRCDKVDTRFPNAARCMKQFPVELQWQCKHRPTATAWTHNPCPGTFDPKSRSTDNQLRQRLRNWTGDTLRDMQYHMDKTVTSSPAAVASGSICADGHANLTYSDFGVTTETFDIYQSWCWDDVNITSVATAEIFGHAYFPGDQYIGLLGDPVAGYPYGDQSLYKTYAQADFGIGCFFSFGCLHHETPTLALYLYYNGYFYQDYY